MGKINVAELLKDCPKGMELDCTMLDNIVFEGIDVSPSTKYPIAIRNLKTNETIYLTKYGQFVAKEGYKCIIFPKGKTTWEGFVPPCKFKDGDIITCNNVVCTFTSIFKDKFTDKRFQRYCSVILDDNEFRVGVKYADYANPRLATEEEKQKLFDAIKENGYKWNAETKTLEKLRQFKVGDIVRLKSKPNCVYTIHSLTWDDNKQLAYRLLPNNDKHLILVSLNAQDDYELIPDKFDINTLVPFESRVLIRDYNYEEWKASFWGYLTNNFYGFNYDTIRGNYKQCIPYEGNEHLLGTTDDCDEYFKIWE